MQNEKKSNNNTFMEMILVTPTEFTKVDRMTLVRESHGHVRLGKGVTSAFQKWDLFFFVSAGAEYPQVRAEDAGCGGAQRELESLALQLREPSSPFSW